MAELLLFQLVAPLGAFGGIAVGERRETAARPSHSALVGCLGAGLGLERTDPRQTNFAANLAFAVRRDHLGPLLADYHTAQTPPAKKGKTWATRREELAGEVNTILSRRDYHSDCAFTIACLVMSETIASPSDLAIALQRPQFTLYSDESPAHSDFRQIHSLWKLQLSTKPSRTMTGSVKYADRRSAGLIRREKYPSTAPS